MNIRKYLKEGMSLYQKFALVIILAGIFPIAILSTVIMDRIFKEHEQSLQENYAQGLTYASYSLDQLLESYNDISKFSYYYSYSSEGSFSYAYVNYDNLRQILTGENYPEEQREQRIVLEMENFLHNVLKVNSTIEEVHFIYYPPDGSMVDYHSGNYTNRFSDMSRFAEIVALEEWDRESRQFILIPTHSFDYIQNSNKRTSQVFTVARNYYNLKGMVGQEEYVGTLFLDFDISQIESIFAGIDLYNRGSLYVCNDAGDCFYSSDSELIGKNLYDESIEYKTSPEIGMLLSAQVEKFGLSICFVMEGSVMDEQMRGIQTLMYGIVIFAVVILSLASLSFSKRLTKPMRVMMEKMGDIETGQFEGQLPVSSKDEVGQLSARFNQMSTELQNYMNQVYVAKLKQTESELNALKSQIYPHFLYNTLEVIRMTAVSGGDEVVAGMIESLSDQIRYLIGAVGDIVTIKDEINNLKKYIYLTNCRYGNLITFTTDTKGLEDRHVPKLILQPIVENAYIHGLKQKSGEGCIQINIDEIDGNLEITIMDNGRGINSDELIRLQNILQSEQAGEKTDSGWKSIGLKNVHDRLRYLYGELYGVSIISTIGVGTAVKVKLPADVVPKED